MQHNQILWEASEEKKRCSQLVKFIEIAQRHTGRKFANYKALHYWSCKYPEEFWSLVAKATNFCEDQNNISFIQFDNEFSSCQFGEGIFFNYAKRAIYHASRSDLDTAIIEANENGECSSYSLKQLRQLVNNVSGWMRNFGVGKNDRVAGILTNSANSVCCYLASATIGAIWASCSPEFGDSALKDRLLLIQPTVLVVSLYSFYNGKKYDHCERIARLIGEIISIKCVLVIDRDISDYTVKKFAYAIPNTIACSHINQIKETDYCQKFEKFPFSHPLALLFSSGTTGKPKAILHGAGGTLLQHLKEHQLHCEFNRDSVVCFYTSTSWMMWNWLVSALASGSTIVLIDGSPMFPSVNRLWRYVDDFNITALGVSPRYLSTVAKEEGYIPIKEHKLDSLSLLLSTGAPLLGAQYDWIYNSVKKDLMVASISGGSDIISCFALGNILQPIKRGEIQAAGLGMDIAAFSDSGEELVGSVGELVCRTPFPSMPLGFWNDPDKAVFRKAYFSSYPNVWTHGDRVIIYEHGGVEIIGRSDTVLNPGGVRIGTGEIYSVIAKIPWITDVVAVPFKREGDEDIVLLVVLATSECLTESRREFIRTSIRTALSPRHIPRYIYAVSSLPRTINGKLSEVTVRKILNNEEINNVSSLADDLVLNDLVAIRRHIQDDKDTISQVDLSIVIPAFNEENRLPATILSYRTWLLQVQTVLNIFSAEIIVVDDGSGDRTDDVATSLSSSFLPIRVIKHSVNLGKGAAVRTGSLKAAGKYILIADADGSTPLEELPKLLACITSGEAQIVVGSRVLSNNEVKRDTKWYRRFLGWLFRGFVHKIAFGDLNNFYVEDTQCGFKLMTKDVAYAVFPKVTINRFAWDVEFLRIAALQSWPVSEVPVSWHHVTGSRINLLTAPFSMLFDLVRIRLTHRQSG